MLCPDCQKKCIVEVCLKHKLNGVHLELSTSEIIGVDDQQSALTRDLTDLTHTAQVGMILSPKI